MASRLDLQNQLEKILGSRNVYYQPPESIKLNYPAIIYSLDRIATKPADNTNYIATKRYNLILIDKNPDSDFIEPILHMPGCRFDRTYKADNLYHYSFTIYY